MSGGTHWLGSLFTILPTSSVRCLGSLGFSGTRRRKLHRQKSSQTSTIIMSSAHLAGGFPPTQDFPHLNSVINQPIVFADLGEREGQEESPPPPRTARRLTVSAVEINPRVA